VSREWRRWLTLAELLAVAGAVIAALTLWNSWSERRAAAADKALAEAGEARARSRLDLAATVADRGDRLLLASGEHELAEIAVTLPRALGGARHRPAVPAIDAGWFRERLLRLTDGGPDEREGATPVLLVARYWDGEAAHTAAAVYDVTWTTEGRLLRGRSLVLTGLRLRDRAGTPAALERAWARTGL